LGRNCVKTSHESEFNDEFAIEDCALADLSKYVSDETPGQDYS